MKRTNSYKVLSLLLVLSLFCPPYLYAIDMSDVSHFVYPEYSKRISMDFKNAQLNDVLKIFSQQSGLNFIAAQNIADKELSLYLDNVPVEQALDRILNANDLSYELLPGSDIFVVKELKKPQKEVVTRVYQLKYATVSNSKLSDTFTISEDDAEETSSTETGTTNVIPGILSALNAVLTKDGSVVEDARTNSLIVTDIPRQFPLIEQTIAKLDIPIPQILIEVEMLDVSKATADLLGLKFGSTPLAFSGGTRNHVYPWDQNSLLNKGRFEFEEEFTAGTIDASGLTAALQFLRTQTDTKSLARPKILTLNNETAQIKIATDEAIGVKQKTSGVQGLTTTTSEFERVQTGVFLTVTPQANPVTGEILLAVSPKVIEAQTGGTFDGSTAKDPEERGAKAILKIRNGDTILLGGLMRNTVSNTVTKWPILGDIPFIGAAFRHKDKSIKERELIIFMTPSIVYDTPRATSSAIEFQKVNREQDIPASRSDAIDRALAVFERKKL